MSMCTIDRTFQEFWLCFEYCVKWLMIKMARAAKLERQVRLLGDAIATIETLLARVEQ